MYRKVCYDNQSRPSGQSEPHDWVGPVYDPIRRAPTRSTSHLSQILRAARKTTHRH
ncbi:hypothetical protein BKA56DRAFT_566370 [Ilyonectria sp. MPI-CAGE-AT-0026]|nr:hypothetical protein BKA56DRAFT_566370 [Ilyonectria sp. MPI-CAGE-AT-0026]